MISVCLASYNGETYLQEQIVSILSQLSEEDELIISDDHSTDKTREVVAEFNDDRIRFYLNEKSGVISNFENAIQKSRGKYIFLSDQDDVWLPNKIKVTLEKLQSIEKENAGVPVMVFSDATVVDKDLNVLIQSIFEHSKENPYLSGTPKILSVANRMMGCTTAFNQETKKYCLPIHENAVMHDWWIALCVAKHGIIAPITTPTILYRQHNTNVVGASLVKKQNKLKNFSKLWAFNKKVYKMSSMFFPMSFLKFIYLKIRLHF